MNTTQKKIKRLLVANRGEIALRVFRAASELKIRTIAIYSHEDRYSMHRYKADEAYLIGKEGESLAPYLDIEELVQLAKHREIDAIHPGYGFLSENVHFARRCAEEGIVFVGPTPEAMERLGDKVSGKKVAREVNVPVIEDSKVPLTSKEVALAEADRIGYPVIVKAAGGGGGRGMRVAKNADNLAQQFDTAQSEAKKAFANPELFLEKYVDSPRHVEVQILGDHHGNLIHLFERDCSVQRRFQKIVEVTPCVGIKPETKECLYEYALRIAKQVNYTNAGTIEFLVDQNDQVFFIEVNPRIQVEHTITEEVTGVDIVRTQILISQGVELSHPSIFLRSQEDVVCSGYAIQCRITTEDPLNDFMPDSGRISNYRSPGGFGIRLDAGNVYSGSVVSPHFDSLLVKVTASGRTLRGASERLQRALREFRVRGVKTNIAFLENVINHPEFQAGKATVRFIEDHEELFEFRPPRNRANKVLRYLSEVCVNGSPDVKVIERDRVFVGPVVPAYDKFGEFPPGTKQKLEDLGRDGFVKWLIESKQIQYTDTTFRDAHQSLLATRVRTLDLLRVADSFAKHHPETFSMEVWGGATFDVCLRFLHECPWHRLAELRKRVPNILLQMLLRGSNAVGYSAYPDNLIVSFIENAAETGIDIFRIFDSMNWLPAMETSIKAVLENTNSLAEVCICYSGDILDPTRTKYTLAYYLDLAKRIEDTGAHILAIKDMAGLLHPYAAEKMVIELKKAVQLPIHFHTHDTSSIQTAAYLRAIDAGVDVIDVAIAGLSGLTSQPNFNSLVAALRGHERELPVDLDSLNGFSNYWERVREYYYPFESGLKSGTAEVFKHEIPGGQYSNLGPQARGLGLEDKFELIKQNYIEVNKLLGDVVKVTPSSKVVGDLAMYMTSNGFTTEDILQRGGEISFPESLKSFFRGDLGQPYQGFPAELQKIVLGKEKPYTSRPNENMEPVDLEGEFEKFLEQFGDVCSYLDFLSYKLYPKVFTDFYNHVAEFGQVWTIPTPAFFFGLQPGEEVMVDIAPGKTLIVELQYVGEADASGVRTISFRLNGQTREIEIIDRSMVSSAARHRKATGAGEVGSPLQGKLAELLVEVGSKVSSGDPLFVVEAMKMASTVNASRSGTIKAIHLSVGSQLASEDLVVEFEH